MNSHLREGEHKGDENPVMTDGIEPVQLPKALSRDLLNLKYNLKQIHRDSLTSKIVSRPSKNRTSLSIGQANTKCSVSAPGSPHQSYIPNPLSHTENPSILTGTKILANTPPPDKFRSTDKIMNSSSKEPKSYFAKSSPSKVDNQNTGSCYNKPMTPRLSRTFTRSSLIKRTSPLLQSLRRRERDVQNAEDVTFERAESFTANLIRPIPNDPTEECFAVKHVIEASALPKASLTTFQSFKKFCGKIFNPDAHAEKAQSVPVQPKCLVTLEPQMTINRCSAQAPSTTYNSFEVDKAVLGNDEIVANEGDITLSPSQKSSPLMPIKMGIPQIQYGAVRYAQPTPQIAIYDPDDQSIIPEIPITPVKKYMASRESILINKTKDTKKSSEVKGKVTRPSTRASTPTFNFPSLRSTLDQHKSTESLDKTTHGKLFKKWFNRASVKRRNNNQQTMGSESSKLAQDVPSEENEDDAIDEEPSSEGLHKKSQEETNPTPGGFDFTAAKQSLFKFSTRSNHRKSLDIEDTAKRQNNTELTAYSALSSPDNRRKNSSITDDSLPFHSPAAAQGSGQGSPTVRSASCKKKHFRFSKHQSSQSTSGTTKNVSTNNSIGGAGSASNSSTGSRDNANSSLEITVDSEPTHPNRLNDNSGNQGSETNPKNSSFSSRLNISFRNLGSSMAKAPVKAVVNPTDDVTPKGPTRVSLTRGESLPASVRKKLNSLSQANTDLTVQDSEPPSETVERRRSSVSLDESALNQSKGTSEYAKLDQAIKSDIISDETLSNDKIGITEKPEEPEPEEVKPTKSRAEEALQRRKYVLAELVETEREYVKDLGSIVDGYMTAVRERNPCPPDNLLDKEKIVWGNLEQIYEWHRDVFSKEIEKCLENPETVGWAFVKYERRFQMYVVYCQNKPKSEYIVSEFLDSYFEEIRLKLGHKLTLADLLIKPVQRIMKYQLLLKDLLKLTERAGQDITLVKKAVEVMCVVPKTANDMMKLSRLQGWDGKISAQGKLLIQDLLTVSPGPPSQPFKGKEWQVYLFEQIVLFSEPITSGVNVAKKFTNAGFIYKNSIKTNKLSLTEHVEGEPLRLILTGKSPEYGEMHFVIQMSSKEAKDTWIREIKGMLSLQRDFLRALQSPIAYQKNLNEAPPLPLTNLTINPASASGPALAGSNAINNLVNKFTYSHNSAKPPRLPASNSHPTRQGGLAGFFSSSSRNSSPKRHGTSKISQSTPIKPTAPENKAVPITQPSPSLPAITSAPTSLVGDGIKENGKHIITAASIDRSTGTGILATLKKAVSQPNRNKLSESQKKLNETRQRQTHQRSIPTIHSAISLGSANRSQDESSYLGRNTISRSLASSPNASSTNFQDPIIINPIGNNMNIKNLSYQKIKAIQCVPPKMYPTIGLVGSDKHNYTFSCTFPLSKLPSAILEHTGAGLGTRDISAQLVEALIRLGLKRMENDSSFDLKFGPQTRLETNCLSWFKVSNDIGIPKNHRERIEQRKLLQMSWLECQNKAASHVATVNNHLTQNQSSMGEDSAQILSSVQSLSTKLSPTNSFKLMSAKSFLIQTETPIEMPSSAISVTENETYSHGPSNLTLNVTFSRCRAPDTGTYFLYFNDGTNSYDPPYPPIPQRRGVSGYDLQSLNLEPNDGKNHKRSGSSENIHVQLNCPRNNSLQATSNEHLPGVKAERLIFKPEHSFPFYLLVLDLPYLMWKPSISESSQTGVRINWRLPPQIEATFAMLPFTIEIQHSNPDDINSPWSPICTQILTHSAIIDKFMILRETPKFRLRIIPENALGKGPPSEPSDLIKFELIPGIPTYSGDDPKIWLSGFFDDYTEKKVLLKGRSCRLVLLCDNKDKEYVGKYVERKIRGGESVAKEYNILRRVQPHPNIVAVFGAYATPRRFIIILEKFNGDNLIDHFHKAKRYSEAQVWDLMYQICNALDYLHSQNIAHLNICPRSIFIVPLRDSCFPPTDPSHFVNLNGTVKLSGFSNASHFPLPPAGSAQRPSVYMNPLNVHYTAPEIFLKRIANSHMGSTERNSDFDTPHHFLTSPSLYPYFDKSPTSLSNLERGNSNTLPLNRGCPKKILSSSSFHLPRNSGSSDPCPYLIVPGEPVPKSDVWSLGVLMLFLLTDGMEPFSRLGCLFECQSLTNSEKDYSHCLDDEASGETSPDQFIMRINHEKLIRVISNVLSFDPVDYLDAFGPPVMSLHAKNFLRTHMLVFDVNKRSSVRKCFSDPVLLKGPPTKTTSILPFESWLPLYDGSQLCTFENELL